MKKQVNIYEEAGRCLLCQDAPCTWAVTSAARSVLLAPSTSASASTKNNTKAI